MQKILALDILQKQDLGSHILWKLLLKTMVATITLIIITQRDERYKMAIFNCITNQGSLSAPIKTINYGI